MCMAAHLRNFFPMFLSPDLVSEYRAELIDPFYARGVKHVLKRGNFGRYINKLAEEVFAQVEDLGVPLDYDVESSDQSSAIASIRKAHLIGAMARRHLRTIRDPRSGHHLELRQTLDLRMELRQQLVQALVGESKGMIDIENCDNIEFAYIGAYAALLHEIGHHIDWESASGAFDFIKSLGQRTASPEMVIETVIDRIGEILGRKIFPAHAAQKKQRLYWISKLGLCNGFLVRLAKDLYEDDSAYRNLVRSEDQFALAGKKKILTDTLHDALEEARAYCDAIREEYFQTAIAPVAMNEGDARSVEYTMKKTMRQVYQLVDAHFIIDNENPDADESICQNGHRGVI